MFHIRGDYTVSNYNFLVYCSKIDRLGTDVISQEEFRAAIESRFSIEMSDDQFKNLVDHVPLTSDGDVKYAEFMAQFDTRYAVRMSVHFSMV